MKMHLYVEHLTAGSVLWVAALPFGCTDIIQLFCLVISE